LLLNDGQDLSGKPNEFIVQIKKIEEPPNLDEFHTYVREPFVGILQYGMFASAL
ncbi:2533_t:CDS:1, partial [Ambispora gerdemannii]